MLISFSLIFCIVRLFRYAFCAARVIVAAVTFLHAPHGLYAFSHSPPQDGPVYENFLGRNSRTSFVFWPCALPKG